MEQDEEMGCILLNKFAKIFDMFSFKSTFDLSKTMLMSSSPLFSLFYYYYYYYYSFKLHFGLNEKEVPHISNCASLCYVTKIPQNVHKI